MKIAAYMAALLAFCFPTFSQPAQPVKVESTLKFPGTYRNNLDTAEKFVIRQENNHLILAITNQGKVELQLVSGMTYKPQHVQPVAAIEFIADSSGNINNFLWHQDLNMEWTKL